MTSGLMLRCNMTKAPDLPAPEPSTSCCLLCVLSEAQLELAPASLMVAHLMAPTPCRLSTTFIKRIILSSHDCPHCSSSLEM